MLSLHTPWAVVDQGQPARLNADSYAAAAVLPVMMLYGCRMAGAAEVVLSQSATKRRLVGGITPADRLVAVGTGGVGGV
jgi:hypothetical protein